MTHFDDALRRPDASKGVVEHVGGNDEKVETIVSRSGARVALGRHDENTVECSRAETRGLILKSHREAYPSGYVRISGVGGA